MTEQKRRLNILLIEDSPRRLKLVRMALEHARTRCRLHTLGAGSDVIRYLRQEAHYEEAPKPDLVLLDYTQPVQQTLDFIAQLRSAEELHRLPFALLTRPETETILERQFESTGVCAVFSPIDLAEFLRMMNAQQPDRFVHAVSLIAALGIVPIRAPADFAGKLVPRTLARSA